MSPPVLRVVALAAAAAVSQGTYPVTVTNCGLTRTYAAAPTRAITMNQGATELMLALGLQNQIVGTAYLDDNIWPKYASAYASIPVLSSSYPNETHIMAQNPDFIVGAYRSAFYGKYTRSSDGEIRGIFSNLTVGPCQGRGSQFGDAEWSSCRPQLHQNGIGTYLFEDACEDTALRATTTTEDTVYEEMRTLAAVFGVDAQPMIDEMKDDFDKAAALVSGNTQAPRLKTVWLDCVGRCCPVADGEEEQVFVGAGSGAPNMLMSEAGLANVFAARRGSWACVKVSEIISAAPDVIVVVDAAWDSAIDKIRYMYNDAEFCQLDVLRAARFVSIPFSATTLSPRNGPAAYDLAIAALHVRTGSHTPTQQSGVGSFSKYLLQAETGCTLCPLQPENVVYTDAGDSQRYEICTTTSTTTQRLEVSKATSAGLGLWGLVAPWLLLIWA